MIRCIVLFFRVQLEKDELSFDEKEDTTHLASEDAELPLLDQELEPALPKSDSDLQ